MHVYALHALGKCDAAGSLSLPKMIICSQKVGWVAGQGRAGGNQRHL